MTDHLPCARTHLGPLNLPFGTLPPTGKRMDAPCCDVFELTGGKIKRFDCYPQDSVILTQLVAYQRRGGDCRPRRTALRRVIRGEPDRWARSRGAATA